MIKEILEMMGPMGGDQRNMRGSTTKVMSSDKYDGKKVTLDLDEPEMTARIERLADEAGVNVRHKYYNDFEIMGPKGLIKKFLKSLGFKPREYSELF